MSSSNKLILKTGDATKIDLPDMSVDLVITHPPYFGINTDRYGGDPNKQINSFSSKKMLKLLEKATKEIYRVLKPDGHFVVANGPADAVDHKYYLHVFENTDFLHASTIIQNAYTHNHIVNRMSEVVTNQNITIWYHFIKSMKAYSNPFKMKKYNNQVWDIPFNNILDPVDIELGKKYFIGDVVNKEVPKRLVEMLTRPGDTVLDPFGGSGIIPITAFENGRSGICLDISEDQIAVAKERAILTLGVEKYKKAVGEND